MTCEEFSKILHNGSLQAMTRAERAAYGSHVVGCRGCRTLVEANTKQMGPERLAMAIARIVPLMVSDLTDPEFTDMVRSRKGAAK